MPPKNIDATIIILDIGRNVAEPEEKNEKSFFENARDCIVRIIGRKIMSRPDDLIGLLLLGSKSTNNNLAEQCENSFRNIHMFTELEKPSWQLIRKLPTKTTNREGDWYEGLLVAADYYKNSFCNVKITNRKIVLMTNFQSPANSGDTVEQVVKGFQVENYEVTIIGSNIYSDNLKGEDIELARQFVEATDGNVATFDDAMGYLLFHRKKYTNAMPWNVDLSMGPNIKIPVSVFGRIRNATILNKWHKAVRDPITDKSSTEESVFKKKELHNTEYQSVPFVETITGYQYGDKVVPFTEYEKSMLYKAGNKCLAVYGFTDASNIKWQNLSGNGVSYLFGRKDNEKADYAINCLIKCMFELNLVGIAKRVYNNGNAPMMHVLMPVIDSENFICLSMIGLNFKEDIKNMAFPPTNLKQFCCTNEQVNAFKDLIKSMDLTCAYDENYDDMEAFPTAKTVNPSIQYVLDCIAFRAMNPGKPLPPPRDELMMLFKMPATVEKKSREPIEKLKKLFELKKVVTKIRDKQRINANYSNMNFQQNTNYSDIPKVQMPNVKDEILNIGTVDPVQDFQTLYKNGKTLAELSVEMTDVLETMVFLNFDNDYNKAFVAMQFFRQECVKNGPAHYNDWFVQFKNNLLDRNMDDILEMLTEKKLNLITKDENDLSAFSAEVKGDDSQSYDIDTMPEEGTELSIQTEVNDFFDEM